MTLTLIHKFSISDTEAIQASIMEIRDEECLVFETLFTNDHPDAGEILYSMIVPTHRIVQVELACHKAKELLAGRDTNREQGS